MPLYHCFGMVLGNLACLTHGAAIVVPQRWFDPLTVLQTVQDEKCTGDYGVPTMFIAELDHPRFAEFNLVHLRTGIMAGSPCHRGDEARGGADEPARDHHRLRHDRNQPRELPEQHRHAAGQARIDRGPGAAASGGQDRGPGNGRHAPGERGEFCTKGYSVMHGYWGDEAKTREPLTPTAGCTPATWPPWTPRAVRTSSAASRDMVIRGGENIYPREIEEFLYRHPQVQDVQVVRARPEIMAKNSAPGSSPSPAPKPTEDDIRAFCKGPDCGTTRCRGTSALSPAFR